MDFLESLPNFFGLPPVLGFIWDPAEWWDRNAPILWSSNYWIEVGGGKNDDDGGDDNDEDHDENNDDVVGWHDIDDDMNIQL